MDNKRYEEDLSYEYDVKLCHIFQELKLDEEEDGPIPLEVWQAIAQAMG